MKVVWLALAHYFTHFTGFFAYLFIIIKRIRMSGTDLVFLSGLAFLTILQAGHTGFLIEVFNVRFFWGWVIFYFIFKGSSIRQNQAQTVLVLLCAYSLIEAVLVNTIMDAAIFPNYPTGGPLIRIFPHLVHTKGPILLVAVPA